MFFTPVMGNAEFSAANRTIHTHRTCLCLLKKTKKQNKTAAYNKS